MVKKTNCYKVGSLFSGIGGIDLAFKKAGFKIKWANEINRKACETYSTNFKHKVICGDIKDLKFDSLEPVDVLTAGFPCQAFSVAGQQKGFDDVRGAVFFELMKAIKAINPMILFLENVKNLKFHNKGQTFMRILGLIENEGYKVKHSVLNACDYSGRPQNRERIYIVCFKNDSCYASFNFPDKKSKIPLIDSVLEKEVDSSFYYDTNQYTILRTLVMFQNKIYQFRNRSYVIENKRNLCPTLTESMGKGGNRVPFILDDKGIRRLIPRECARLQGFPDTFVFPSGCSVSSSYRQIGNSVSVPVVTKIAKNIMKALKTCEDHKCMEQKLQEVI